MFSAITGVYPNFIRLQSLTLTDDRNDYICNFRKLASPVVISEKTEDHESFLRAWYTEWKEMNGYNNRVTCSDIEFIDGGPCRALTVMFCDQPVYKMRTWHLNSGYEAPNRELSFREASAALGATPFVDPEQEIPAAQTGLAKRDPTTDKFDSFKRFLEERQTRVRHTLEMLIEFETQGGEND